MTTSVDDSGERSGSGESIDFYDDYVSTDPTILDPPQPFTPDVLVEFKRWVARLANSVEAALGGSKVPRWDDLRGTIDQGTGLTALTYENYRDTGVKYFHFQYNQSDELHKRYQMPHNWYADTDAGLLGSVVKPHMHVIPLGNAVADQVIVFEVKYAWSKVGREVPADIDWTTTTASRTIAVADKFVETIIPLATITPPSWAGPSAHLHLRVTNLISDPSYTYKTNKTGGTIQANIALISADVHYQAVGLGTIAEYPT